MFFLRSLRCSLVAAVLVGENPTVSPPSLNYVDVMTSYNMRTTFLNLMAACRLCVCTSGWTGSTCTTGMYNSASDHKISESY